MAFTASLFNPEVDEYGSARIYDDTYKADNSADWYAGEFLRLTSGGEIKPATDGTASINAFALNDYDASEEGEVFKPILLIAEDTIFKGQYNAVAGSITSALIGSRYDLSVSSNKWMVDTTQGNAPDASTPGNLAVEITDIYDNDKWYNSGKDESGDYGLVKFKILPAKLDVAKTA